MKVNEIDHICIAAKGLAAAGQTWEPVLSSSGFDETHADNAAEVRAVRYLLG